jgi:hypothetical protein
MLPSAAICNKGAEAVLEISMPDHMQLLHTGTHIRTPTLAAYDQTLARASQTGVRHLRCSAFGSAISWDTGYVLSAAIHRYRFEDVCLVTDLAHRPPGLPDLLMHVRASVHIAGLQAAESVPPTILVAITRYAARGIPISIAATDAQECYFRASFKGHRGVRLIQYYRPEVLSAPLYTATPIAAH